MNYKIIKGSTKNIVKIEKDVSDFINELEEKEEDKCLTFTIDPVVSGGTIYIFIYYEYIDINNEVHL